MSERKQDQTSRDEDIKALGEKINDVRFAMLTTIAPDGSLRSRPMTTQQIEFDGDLWFFVGRDTEPVRHIGANPRVNVAYAKPDDNLYVSVSGQASISDDAAKKKELWHPLYKAWYPEGLEDPTLALIKINVASAEYWDSPHGAVVTLLGFAKAIITGKRYENSESDNKELDLSKA